MFTVDYCDIGPTVRRLYFLVKLPRPGVKAVGILDRGRIPDKRRVPLTGWITNPSTGQDDDAMKYRMVDTSKCRRY